jgi:hypothetical protein
MQLTPPGDIFRADYRPSPPQHASDPPCPPVVRMVQFNIERGYKLDAIIPALREIDADILSLQEVDVGCDRSGGVDTGTAIAEALRLNYAFLSEFEELRSPVRDARSQGGKRIAHVASSWSLYSVVTSFCRVYFMCRGE